MPVSHRTLLPSASVCLDWPPESLTTPLGVGRRNGTAPPRHPDHTKNVTCLPFSLVASSIRFAEKSICWPPTAVSLQDHTRMLDANGRLWYATTTPGLSLFSVCKRTEGRHWDLCNTSSASMSGSTKSPRRTGGRGSSSSESASTT